ncbi:hypothetical protein Pan216_52180 [Planctomycetes bacterium Pan216]|uniref:Cytidylyltransferase family protein n=1 Tax=Kolteria novifilia TaxID=2527975 RepID=A0A518BBG3_9BACT|nr:hypothetical protein Pan216_52180 [Planctomycetes bacterium Pan216]
MPSPWNFLWDNVPPWWQWAAIGPPSLVYAAGVLLLAGHLHQWGWGTAETRKLVHVGVFLAATVLQTLIGLPGVIVFGVAATVIVAGLVARGSERASYQAVARVDGGEKGKFSVLLPYVATVLGGVTTNFLFGPLAIVGYLVVGMGDALGEVIGRRFGRNRYRVTLLGGHTASRSWEGSAAVFVGSLAALVVGGLLLGAPLSSSSMVVGLPLVALAAAAVEALSPSDWDNATLQIAPTAFMSLWW